MKTRMTLLVVAMLGLVACQAKAGVIFSDNFDSYANGTLLGDTAAWSTSVDQYGSIKVYNGQAQSTNNYYGSSAFYKAYVDGISQADYTVSVDGIKFPGYNGFFYALGRVSGNNYVYAEAIPSSGNLYLRIGDSAGNQVGDYWFSTYDGTLPVNITLSMQGADVTAVATYGDASQTLSFQTSVLDAGSPGFGASGNQWISYAVVKFDNFVVSSVPEPATLGLLAMGGLAFLKRKNS